MKINIVLISKTRLLLSVLYTLIFSTVFISCKQKENKADVSGWEKIGPGGGGATFIPVFSYHSSEKFIIRCDMTGSYLTNDGGVSYRQINYPGGASAYAWDPLDSNTVYIGSAALNRSTDGGNTWEQIFPTKEETTRQMFSGDHADFSIETSDTSLYSSETGRVTAIRVDPLKQGILYFSMGNNFYYTDSAGIGFRRLTVQNPIDFIYTNKELLKDKVYIFTSDSIFVFDKKSGKLSPKNLPAGMSPAFSFTGGTLAESDKVILYALHHDPDQEISGEFGHTELWKSSDLGNTWKRVMHQAVTNSAAGIKPSFSMISCSENDAGKAYLITNRYEERKDKGFIYWYGALKTNDEDNWDWVWKGGGGSGQYGIKDGIGVSNLKDAWAEKAFGGEYIRLMDVGVSPSDGNVAIVTDWYRSMKTTNGGRTWNEAYSIEQPDGSFISRGLDVTTAYGVHFDPFDSNHIAISYTDIAYHHSFNGGKSWLRSAEGVPSEWINTCYWLVFDPDVKGKIWSVWSSMHDIPRGKMTRNPRWKETVRGGVCMSDDGGKTWTPNYEGMGFDSPSTSIVIDPLSPPGKRTLYVSVYNKGVFKSTDDGKTWQLKNNGIGDNTCAFELTLTDKGILFLTISATPEHRDGKKGRLYYPGAVYRSDDGAESWTKLNISEGVIFPNGIDFDRDNPDRIYLGCWSDIYLSDLVGGDVARDGGNDLIEINGGIYLSEDGGNTWNPVLDKNQYVYDVTVDPFHKGRVFCNTFNQAAWRSDDSGQSWKRIKGYDFHWGQRIVIDNNDKEKIYITTFGSSVWHGVPLVE